MIHHITFQEAGGINTYIDNLIAGSVENQKKIELHKNQAQDQLSAYQIQYCHPEDTYVFHDPNLCHFAYSKKPQKYVLVLHQDSSFYYNSVEQLGQWVDGIVCVAATIQNNLPTRYKAKSIILSPCIINETSGNQSTTGITDSDIIFVGREDKNKGAHLLPEIDRYIQSKDCTCTWTIVLGSRPENLTEFRSWMDKENHRVTLIESIPNQLLQKVICGHSCLILPSETEGHPMVVIEAMAAGTAPFTFHYSEDCDEHFPHDPEHLVTPSKTAAEIADRISKHLNRSKSSQEDWQHAAYNFVDEHHNPKSQAQKLLQFSERIQQTNKSRSRLLFHKWKRRGLIALQKW